jgi:hypothetical protein
LCSLFLAATGFAATPQTNAEDDQLVPFQRCRVLDTRTLTAADGAVTGPRQVDISATRCGALVPSLATALSIEVQTLPRDSSGASTPAAPAGVVSRMSRNGGLLDLNVPSGQHISVDIVGYYVPASLPVDPFSSGDSATTHRASTNEAGTAASVRTSALRTGVDTINSGTAGLLDLNGTSFFGSSTGAFLSATTATSPWVILQSGNTNNTGGGIMVTDAAHSENFRITADGSMMFHRGFLSARTAYTESQSIATNIVHDVTISDPYNSSGGATGEVTFFNAVSSDEAGSPGTAKFRASSLGYYGTAGQRNINFDSQIGYHNPNQYYYRGVASAAAFGGIETFYVKAGTGDPANSQYNTRADMYVSGNVGLGVAPSTAYKLDVTGSVHATGDIISDGVINAKYQDVAEWVPAQKDMPAGTVVVLDQAKGNAVLPSSIPYDTTVAGVVSAQPGLILGEGSDSKAKVATTGRVKVRVDAAAAPIAVGDLLVTSSKSGMAMKSEPMEINGRKFHQPGTIVGKALQPLASGQGEILVLLSLQ